MIQVGWSGTGGKKGGRTNLVSEYAPGLQARVSDLDMFFFFINLRSGTQIKIQFFLSIFAEENVFIMVRFLKIFKIKILKIKSKRA